MLFRRYFQEHVDQPQLVPQPGIGLAPKSPGVVASARAAFHSFRQRHAGGPYSGHRDPPTGVVRRSVLSLMGGAVTTFEVVRANPPSMFAGAADRSAFLACPLTRAAADAYRIVYAGDLTPRAGVVDFLSCAIDWAEANPSASIDIVWVGEGDMRAVLRARPAPANLTQKFVATPEPAGLAGIFAQSGLLVAPALSDRHAAWVGEAMASGLPVLGSIRCSLIRALVTHAENGWLFDPLAMEDMYDALDAALIASPERLNTMRRSAHARVTIDHAVGVPV